MPRAIAIATKINWTISARTARRRLKTRASSRPGGAGRKAGAGVTGSPGRLLIGRL